jgi:hypothetical protein
VLYFTKNGCDFICSLILRISAEQMINWIHNFLTDRIQQVVVNGVESEWKPVTSGIPQGSVLGPLMFVIFINDLPDTVNGQVYIFADDTKVFKNIQKAMDGSILQNDLNSMSIWSDTWLLKFHPEKCKHMTIGSKHNEWNNSYKLGNTKLQHINSEKDIGVIIDNQLKFDKHI